MHLLMIGQGLRAVSQVLFASSKTFFAPYKEPLEKKRLDDHRNAWLKNSLFLLDSVHITLIESKLNEGEAGYQHSDFL